MPEEEMSRRTPSTGQPGPSSSRRASSSTTATATDGTTQTDAKAKETSTPAEERATPTYIPVLNHPAAVGAPPASTEVTNSEVSSSQPYVVEVGGTSTTIVIANAPATGEATSVTEPARYFFEGSMAHC